MNVDFDKIKEDATGKWIDIARQLGIEVREDGRHAPCVICGGSDRARIDKDFAEKGGYYCGQCGPHDGVSLVQKVLGVDFKGALEAVASVVGGCKRNVVPKEKKITPETLRKMFDGGNRTTTEDVSGQYLLSRGLSTMPLDSAWYSPKCWEPETKKEQKALLGVFQMPDGKAVCMQRIYLDNDGAKLDIVSQKKLTPALVGNISGGAVRLFPLEGKTLIIAEWIETAIAAHEDFGFPAWSAVSSTLLENFVPPDEIDHLIIVADNDKNFTGQKAAYVLANRVVVTYKKEASVFVPEHPGDDWLDVLNNQKKCVKNN